MPTFDALRLVADNRKLIRKFQKSMVMGRIATTPLPTSLFTTGSTGALMDFKADGWLPFGIMTQDGIEYEREVSSESVSGLGYSGSLRSDPTEVVRSVSFTPMEYGRRHMQELVLGADFSGVKQTLANGEIVYDEPEMPVNQEWQLLIIGVDGPATDQWVAGKGFGATKINSAGSQTWGQTDPVTTPIKMDVFTDDASGTPTRHYLGGTGAKKASVALGWAQATA